MKLKDLFEAVKEKKLSKQQLEDYHLELTSLYAQMMWELAELEKAEAIYFLAIKEKTVPEPSDISVKRTWRSTANGQRLIELKNYEKATTKVLASLRSRMYSTY